MRLVSSSFSLPCTVLIKTRQPATSSRHRADGNSTALYRLHSTSHISGVQPEPMPPLPLQILTSATQRSLTWGCQRARNPTSVQQDIVKGKIPWVFSFFFPKSLTRRSVCMAHSKNNPTPSQNQTGIYRPALTRCRDQAKACTGCSVTMEHFFYFSCT